MDEHAYPAPAPDRRVAGDGSVTIEDEILHLDKSDDRLEAIGLLIAGAKAVQAGIQERVVTAQAASFLNWHRCCMLCGRGLRSKGPCQSWNSPTSRLGSRVPEPISRSIRLSAISA